MVVFCRNFCIDWKKKGFRSFDECYLWCIGEEEPVGVSVEE